MDVARRQFDRRLDRLVGVFELVVFLEIGLEPFQDLDRILNRRLVDVDLLEAPHQRAVLLEILTVLFIRCRADAADRAGGERRLEQVGRVHRAAGGRAGADHGVDLVDEHDRAGIGLDLLDHLLEPLLEVAAIARAGEQRAHIEREDGGAFEHVRHLAMHDAARQALGDRGLADAGIADEQRIVLLPAAEHLDRPVDLGVAADQRIDLAVLGFLVEVDAIGVERIALLFGLVAALGIGLLVGAAHRPRLGQARPLGDAVADIIDRVVARHVLLLQEIGGVAFALGEDRHQHVGAGDLLAAGGLHVDDRALDHALEAGGRLGILGAVGDQVFQFGFEIGDQTAAQLVEIDIAGPHHRRGVLIVDQRQQQVFQGRIFVVPLIGDGERPVERLLETARERWHQIPISFCIGRLPNLTFFPSRIAEDADVFWQSP